MASLVSRVLNMKHSEDATIHDVVDHIMQIEEVAGWTMLALVQTSAEVSDDICSHLRLTRLVSIAALLRRYSPSPHPLLRLLTYVPALYPNG